MGVQMSKELGVYNEEEKVCTPLGPQRYRLLNNDPRSVTLGINRTPIQVQCTPTGVKTTSEMTEDVLKDSFTEETENTIGEQINESDDSNKLENDTKHICNIIEEEEHTRIVNQNVEATSIGAEVRYLETDIDKLDLSVSESLPTKGFKPIIALNDVRSPTSEITRTPVLVQCTPELFAVHSRIDSLSFCDIDAQLDDPSAIVSDDDLTSPKNHSSINNWLEDVENKASDSPLNTSYTDSPKTVAKKQKELNALKKKLFFTPDAKETTTKPKARTPLGNLQASQLHASPQKLMRAKQWRNIKEERQRRGIQDTENTPPSLPPLNKVSSAPGKMVDRKRSKTLWDEENTMLI